MLQAYAWLTNEFTSSGAAVPEAGGEVFDAGADILILALDTVQIAIGPGPVGGHPPCAGRCGAGRLESKRFNGIALDVSDADVKVAYDDPARLAAGIVSSTGNSCPSAFRVWIVSPRRIPVKHTLAKRPEGSWQRIREASRDHWLFKLVGWLMTAVAVSFGAPFWFDLLNKLANLRATCGKPAPPPAEATG